MMAQRVIDSFEMIKIKEYDRHFMPIAFRGSDGLRDAIIELYAIREFGE